MAFDMKFTGAEHLVKHVKSRTEQIENMYKDAKKVRIMVDSVGISHTGLPYWAVSAIMEYGRSNRRKRRKAVTTVDIFGNESTMKPKRIKYGKKNPYTMGTIPARPYIRRAYKKFSNEIFLPLRNIGLDRNVNNIAYNSIARRYVAKMRYNIKTANAWAVPLSKLTKRSKKNKSSFDLILRDTFGLYKSFRPSVDYAGFGNKKLSIHGKNILATKRVTKNV